MTMKLLSATPSPYARKVRIALDEKAIPFELVTTVPWNADTVAPEYNPLEKIPILILEDGETIFESRYILEWLEVRFPDPALVPAEPGARLAAKKVEVLADGICDAFVLHFLERHRPEIQRSQSWLERQMRKIAGGMRALEQLMPEQGFCIADQFGLADIAAGTVADYLMLRFPEYQWRAGHPHLAALRDRLSMRPSFTATIPVAQQIDTLE